MSETSEYIKANPKEIENLLTTIKLLLDVRRFTLVDKFTIREQLGNPKELGTDLKMLWNKEYEDIEMLVMPTKELEMLMNRISEILGY